MPFVAPSQKPADVAGGDESGSGLPLPEGPDADSDAGSNEDLSGSFDRADTPAGVLECDSTDDDTDSRVSETRGEEASGKDAGRMENTSERVDRDENRASRESFPSRAVRVAARA